MPSAADTIVASTRSFGDQLRDHRLAAGLTQAAFAERASISHRTVQDLERGISWPQRDTVARLLGALNVATADQDAFHEAAAARPRRRRGRSVDRAQPTESHASWPPHRSVFVGRENERSQLQDAFAASCAGRGNVVMLAGEPGIGKTALCEQVAAEVAAKDGLVLVGRCFEERLFSRPYQPFVEVLETYARARDTAALLAEVGNNLVEIARIVPLIRTSFDVEIPARPEAAPDPLRPIQAVVETVRNIAAAQPLLIVLDDLHAADRATLDLLLHLPRNLEGSRILVIGTYRDVEVDRMHPLASVVAELTRSSNVHCVHLRGLSLDEVQQVLHVMTGQTAPLPLAELVYSRTEGNVLFVHELLRFVVDGNLLERHNGTLRFGREEDLARHIPEGLREVVSGRLSRLGRGAIRTLHIAAVIGREFALDILRRVHPGPDDALEDELQEAVDAGILDERSAVPGAIAYRFRHAFIRRVLYDEILAPRRIRLHGDVARALEESHASRPADHAVELAEHFSLSSELGKAVEYATTAAAQASDVFAFGNAVRQLERALALQNVVDPNDDVRRCDILLALGEALGPLGETPQVIERIGPDALQVAEKLGGRSRAFRASRLVLEALSAQGAGTSTGREDYALWAGRAMRYACPDSIERAYAHLAQANAVFVKGEAEQAYQLRLDALALGRKYQDNETICKAAFQLLLVSPPHRWVTRFQVLDELSQWSGDGVSAHVLGEFLFFAGSLELVRGQRSRGEAVWSQLDNLVARTHLATAKIFSLQRSAVLDIVDGRLEAALENVDRFARIAENAGASARGRQFTLLLAHAPLVYLGRAGEWLKALERFAPIPGSAAVAQRLIGYRAACLAHLGRLEEARALLEPLLEDEAAGRGDMERNANLMMYLFETAVLVGHKAAAAAMRERLEPIADASMGDWFYTCVARHLGAADLLLGDVPRARQHFTQALDATTRIQFRPETALCHLELAELLARAPEPGCRFAARRHLDTALPELREMRMEPALKRAMRLAPRLQSAHPGSSVHAEPGC